MGLIRSLEDINVAIKQCSRDFFDFEIENDSLFKVSPNENQISDVVKKHLEIIFWIHKKISAQKKSFFNKAFTRPDENALQKLQIASQLDQISKEVILRDDESEHKLTNLYYKSLNSKFDHLLQDFESQKLSGFLNLKYQVNKFLNIIKSD